MYTHEHISIDMLRLCTAVCSSKREVVGFDIPFFLCNQYTNTMYSSIRETITLDNVFITFCEELLILSDELAIIIDLQKVNYAISRPLSTQRLKK